jgi:uncharacterized protein YbjT (DUF2867 family)
MICVTGASGTLSSEVIRQLEGQKIPFRAAYFSDRAASAARTRGVDAALIDYNRPDTLRAAFGECTTLFLLGPNALNQTELELKAVDAARAVGVRHIVKQSVMGAAEEAYSLAKIHRPVEKAIEKSGIGWTFLRPNSFMQNAVTLWRQPSRPKALSTVQAVKRGSATSTSVTSPRWQWQRSRPKVTKDRSTR